MMVYWHIAKKRICCWFDVVFWGMYDLTFPGDQVTSSKMLSFWGGFIFLGGGSITFTNQLLINTLGVGTLCSYKLYHIVALSRFTDSVHGPGGS